VTSIVFVKLGGSLITDKTQPFTARVEVIERLAREVADSWDAHEGQLVLGHGSGSFGHVAAEQSGLLDRPSGATGEAVSRTQRAASALHRRVTDALRDEGLPVYSVAPSSAFVASGGEPVEVQSEPGRRALDLGAVPVTYGDVVMDREQGATICSTESVFRALIDGLEDQGVTTRRVLWFGDTEGVYDEEGETIDVLSPDRASQLLDQVGTASGTDVTGGMRHRLRTARTLALRGVPSLITSGLEADRLWRVLRGDTVPGTEVLPKKNVAK
jgi:isopentenyl phosphate kinase